MDVVNVVMFYMVIISDVTNEFLHRDNKDLLNWIELNCETITKANTGSDYSWVRMTLGMRKRLPMLKISINAHKPRHVRDIWK